MGDDARSKQNPQAPILWYIDCHVPGFVIVYLVIVHVERRYICNALVLQCGGYNYLWPAVPNAESGWLDIYMVRTSPSSSCSDALQWAPFQELNA